MEKRFRPFSVLSLCYYYYYIFFCFKSSMLRTYMYTYVFGFYGVGDDTAVVPFFFIFMNLS